VDGAAKYREGSLRGGAAEADGTLLSPCGVWPLVGGANALRFIILRLAWRITTRDRRVQNSPQEGSGYAFRQRARLRVCGRQHCLFMRKRWVGFSAASRDDGGDGRGRK